MKNENLITRSSTIPSTRMTRSSTRMTRSTSDSNGTDNVMDNDNDYEDGDDENKSLSLNGKRDIEPIAIIVENSSSFTTSTMSTTSIQPSPRLLQPPPLPL